MKSRFFVLVFLVVFFVLPLSVAATKHEPKDDEDEDPYTTKAEKVIECETKNYILKLPYHQNISGVKSYPSYKVTVETLDALKKITSCTAIEAQEKVIIEFKIRDYIFEGSNSCYFPIGAVSNRLGLVGIGIVSKPPTPKNVIVQKIVDLVKKAKPASVPIKTARLQCEPSKNTLPLLVNINRIVNKQEARVQIVSERDDFDSGHIFTGFVPDNQADNPTIPIHNPPNIGDLDAGDILPEKYSTNRKDNPLAVTDDGVTYQPLKKADWENTFYGNKDPKEGRAEINGTSKIGDVSSIRVNPNPDIKNSGATAYEDGRLISFGDTEAKNPGVTTYNPGGVVQTPEDNFKSSNTDLENQFNKPNTGYNLTQARYQADIQGGQRNELSNYKKLIPKKEQIPPNTDFGSGGGGGFGGGFGGGSSGGSAGSSNLLNSLVGGFGSIAGKFLGQKIAGQGEQKPKTKTVERQKPVCFAFNASKNTIKEGETTELRWLMRFTDTVTITSLGTVPTVGKVTISPELEAGEIHKEYVLTAKNRYGSITCPPVRITVLPEGSEAVDTNDPNSDVLINCTNGSKAIVLWQCPIGTYKSVGSSTEHKAFNTLGRVEGAVVVEPDVPSTFVVRCNDEQNNEIGRNSCLVRLSGSTVQNGGNTNKNPNPNTCTPQANVIVDANEIQTNTRATIRWESECVSSCKLRMFDIGGGAELAPQLGIQGKIVGNLISDTRFDLECKGFDGGSVGDSEVIRAI